MQLTLRSSRAPAPPEPPTPTRRDVVLVGAHGGAGVTTLQALLGPAQDLGVVRNLQGPEPPVRPHDRPLVVVCRGTVPGSRRATETVNAILRGGQSVAALVVVADGAGPLPGDARARFTLLADRVGGVVHVPFHPGFRLLDDPSTAVLPMRLRHAIAAICDLTDRTEAT